MRQIKLLREKQSSEKSTIWQRNQLILEKLRSKYYETKKFNIPLSSNLLPFSTHFYLYSYYLIIIFIVHQSKVPRPITTSASGCRALWLKATLMGVNVTSCEAIEESIKSLRDKPKKWHMPSAFRSVCV